RRAGLPAHHRPQEGRDRAWRPQHPPGAHRGARHAPRGGRARGRGAGARCAPRREGVPRRDGARRLAGGARRTPRPSRCGRPVEIRHAGIFSAAGADSDHGERQDAQARYRAVDRAGRGDADADPLAAQAAGQPMTQAPSMRAVVVREFGPIESAALGELPKPTPKDDEVLVEVRATAANFVDLLVIGGTYQFLPERPFAPGKLPAGTVSAVGAAVETFKPGDRVLTMAEHGGYGAFVAVPASQCFRLPPSLSFVDAAAMSLVYDTAWFALTDRARLAEGDAVLVLGAS